jgi:hypothetical protein
MAESTCVSCGINGHLLRVEVDDGLHRRAPARTPTAMVSNCFASRESR